MNPLEPLGWNPTKKMQAMERKRRVDPNSILMKHKRFLKDLEERKVGEKILKEQQEQQNQVKKEKFRENAAN